LAGTKPLLPSRKARLWSAIEAAGLNQAAFDWFEPTNLRARYRVVHRRTKFYFEFREATDGSGWPVECSPGHDRVTYYWTHVDWAALLSAYEQWLTYLKVQVEAVDAVPESASERPRLRVPTLWAARLLLWTTLCLVVFVPVAYALRVTLGVGVDTLVLAVVETAVAVGIALASRGPGSTK